MNGIIPINDVIDIINVSGRKVFLPKIQNLGYLKSLHERSNAETDLPIYLSQVFKDSVQWGSSLSKFWNEIVFYLGSMKSAPDELLSYIDNLEIPFLISSDSVNLIEYKFNTNYSREAMLWLTSEQMKSSSRKEGIMITELLNQDYLRLLLFKLKDYYLNQKNELSICINDAAVELQILRHRLESSMLAILCNVLHYTYNRVSLKDEYEKFNYEVLALIAVVSVTNEHIMYDRGSMSQEFCAYVLKSIIGNKPYFFSSWLNLNQSLRNKFFTIENSVNDTKSEDSNGVMSNKISKCLIRDTFDITRVILGFELISKIYIVSPFLIERNMKLSIYENTLDAKSNIVVSSRVFDMMIKFSVMLISQIDKLRLKQALIDLSLVDPGIVPSDSNLDISILIARTQFNRCNKTNVMTLLPLIYSLISRV